MHHAHVSAIDAAAYRQYDDECEPPLTSKHSPKKAVHGQCSMERCKGSRASTLFGIDPKQREGKHSPSLKYALRGGIAIRRDSR